MNRSVDDMDLPIHNNSTPLASPEHGRAQPSRGAENRPDERFADWIVRPGQLDKVTESNPDTRFERVAAEPQDAPTTKTEPDASAAPAAQEVATSEDRQPESPKEAADTTEQPQVVPVVHSLQGKDSDDDTKATLTGTSSIEQLQSAPIPVPLAADDIETVVPTRNKQDSVHKQAEMMNQKNAPPAVAENSSISSGESSEADVKADSTDSKPKSAPARPTEAAGPLAESSPPNPDETAPKEKPLAQASDTAVPTEKPLARASDTDATTRHTSDQAPDRKAPRAKNTAQTAGTTRPTKESPAGTHEKTVPPGEGQAPASGSTTDNAVTDTTEARTVTDQHLRAPAAAERATAQVGEHTPTRGEPDRPMSQIDQMRLIQRVARAIHSAPERGGVIRLRLHPRELGSLQLEVRLESGRLSARLEAETAQARNVLMDNLPQLRDRLAEQGIRVDRFDVNVSQQDTGRPQQDPRQHQSPYAGGRERQAGSRQEAPGNHPDAVDRARQIIGQQELNVII